MNMTSLLSEQLIVDTVLNHIRRQLSITLERNSFQQYLHNSFLIYKRILELKIENVEYFIKSKSSLRGGGCGGTKIKNDMHTTIPTNYIQNMKSNSQLLVDKCNQLQDNFSRNEIMISLQWFFDNRYWICEICKNDNLILKIYDIALSQFQQLISVIPIYLRGSGCLCYYVLEVCNDLLMIIYTYQLKDEKRFLYTDLHGELLSMIDIFKMNLEVHNYYWTNGLEFQITLIKTVLLNSRTKSKNKYDKLKQIGSSLFSSLLQFSLKEQFLNAIFDCAKDLLTAKYYQFQFPIETYQIYYFFFLLKSNIIKNIQENKVESNLIKNLQQGYEKYVMNSENWIVHFCWINAISDLISTRKIISKTEFLKTLDENKQKQLWNEYIDQNIIQELSYDKLLVQVNNNISYESMNYDQELTLDKLGYKKMKQFQNDILNQQFAKKQNFFKLYLDFTFKKLKKPEEQSNIQQQLELLSVDEQSMKLQNLYQMLEKILRIFEQYSKCLVNSTSIPSQQVETKTQDNQQDLAQDQQGDIQQLDVSLFKLSYILYEIDITMIIEKKRIEICLEQAKLDQSQNEKDNKKKNKDNKEKEEKQLNQLETIYKDWTTKYNEIFNLISKHKGFHLKFSKIEKMQSQEQQIQIQENDLSVFIRDIQISIKRFLQEFSLQQQSLQNFLELNNKQIKIIDEEQLDQKLNEFFLDFIERDNLLFIDDEYHKKIMESLIQQNFQKLEDINKFDSNLKNYIKMSKILKGQIMQTVYIFSKLELNLKSVLGTKNFKEHKSISELIKLQEKEIELFISQDLKDQSNISKILQYILRLRDKIIDNFAQQQNTLFSSALILQTELFNSVYNFNLSSEQDFEQFKKEIQDKYQQYKNIEQQNNDQNENSHKQIQKVQIEQNEQSKLLSKKITELNKQIIVIHNIIDKMEILSQYIHQNCSSIIYLNEVNFPESLFLNIKNIIKVQINKLELVNLLQEFIKGVQEKKQSQRNQIQNKINFSLKDFAIMFCYNSLSSDILVKIDKNYQDILDNLQQEVIVERKFYDLSKDYIVRECFLFHMIKIQSQVPEKKILQFCQEYIQQIWLKEKDKSVRALLKNKEMVEMQKQLFSHDLKTFSASIKQEMNQRMQEMKAIESEIRFEGNLSKRDELSKKLTNQYEEFEEFLESISEMQQQLDITLIFLKELQKNMKQIKKQINYLQESINEIGNDVRKLRGKKYEELFEIRKEKVKSQAYLLELDSIYIPLNTQEINPFTGQIQKTSSGKDSSELLIEDQKENKQAEREGEVNQFIYEEANKDVMLIKGQAGCGKSRAAKKIEKYLWSHYKDLNDWIPIYISLPQLKNPKFNLLDQALESENYGFDKLQLKDFKEAIQNNKIQVVMILDSYDEMKQDCIQSNLILTNRLIQDLNQENKQIKNVKFIITTRKEILISLGYQTWFFGNGLETFKEVEIMNFDEKQSENYLKHYVKLSIKRRIKSQYDFVKQIKQERIDIQEFLKIWNKIENQVINQDDSQEDSVRLLDDKQIQYILELIKIQSAFQYVLEGQLIILQKELADLWSASLFNKTIENLSIKDILTTPFMLEIVVQTLPSLSKKYKGSNDFKESFQNNFLILKKRQNLSKQLIQQYNFSEQYQDQKIKQVNNNQQRQIDKYQDKQDLEDLNKILDRLERKRFFENFSITNISSVKNELKNINDDDLKVVIPALTMQKFTIYDFYLNFIEFYHEQQIQKLRQLGKIDNMDSFIIDLVQFSESLALEMTINQTTQVNYQQKGRLKLNNKYFDQNDEGNWKMKYFDDLEDEYKKLVRSSALINLKGKSYSFNHKSIQEFYVAQHINNLMDKFELIDNQITDNSKNQLENSVFNQKQFNISLENYLGSLNILKQKLKLKDQNNLKLISIAKQSKKQEFKVASSNSFCLLSYLQVYLGEQEFQGIHLEKTTLKGLSFYKSKLQHSIFNEVIIDSCLFDEANLENAKWNNIICSEKPYLEGHEDSVLIIQYSNDGKIIASGGSEKVIKFWDSNTFQQIGEIRDISVKPKFLVFTPDDQMLFVSGDRNKIESWLINDLKNIQKTNHKINKYSRVILMQLSQNQKELVVVSGDGLIQFWDVNLIRKNFKVKDGFILKNSESEIKCIQFFKNGEMLASANRDREVTLWNVKEQKVLAVIKLDFLIHQLAINQTSEYLVCVPSEYDNFNVWKIENLKQPYLIRNSSKFQIKSILLTKDDQQSVCNLGDAILIQNVYDQEKFYEITYSQCIDFSPDENLVAIGQNEQIALWSIFTSSQIVKELLFICNGTKLLSGDEHQDLKLWSIEKCQLIAVFSKFYQQNITISSDFDKIVISTIEKHRAIISLSQHKSKSFNHRSDCKRISILQNEQLIVVQKRNAQQVIGLQNNQQIEFENSPNNFQQCVFSHKSSLFASYSENSKILIWNQEGMRFIQKHEDKCDSKISFMIFSFDDKYLALTSKTDKLIKIWDFCQNQIYSLKEPINETEEEYNYLMQTEICFSYDSQQVAFYNNNEITIWKFISDQNSDIFTYNNHSRIRTIASSPKQNLFATSDEELNFKFLHFETKQLLLSFSTREQTNSLCFTYDGKYLISARIKFKLWDIQNFPEIKLSAESDSYNNEDILKICCLSQSQGIWYSSSQNSRVMLFDDFEYLGILESSNQVRIQCQFSADSQFLVGGINEKVIIWNIHNNYEIQFSRSLPNTIESVTYCQDQNRLVVTILSGIYILNVKSNDLVEVIPNLNSAVYAKMYFNDEYLYTKEKQSVKIWKNNRDNQFTLIDYYSLMESDLFRQITEDIVFSQDGKYLAKLRSAYYIWDQIPIIIYPVDMKSKQRFIFTKNLSKIAISNNLEYLLYGNQELSKLSYFESNFIIKEFIDLGYFEFCPDNHHIVFFNNYNFTIYNIISNNVIFQLSSEKFGYSEYSTSFEFTNYGKLLVMSSRQVYLFNMTKINKPQLIGVICEAMNSVAPKTSSNYLALQFNQDSIQIIEMIQSKFIRSLHIPNIIVVEDLVLFQNDSKVAFQQLEEFNVFDINENAIEYNLGKTIACDKIAISKDRNNLIFSSKNQVYLYEKENHQEFNKLEEDIKFLYFSFSQDSKYLAGCGSNKIIYFWDFKARKVMAKFLGHSEQIHAAQISQDNSTLASVSVEKYIRLWNLNVDFNRLSQDGHENIISNIEFSPDGLVLYSGGLDQTLKLWDIQHKALLISKLFNYPIYSFSISNNQDHLIISQGEIVELWSISLNQAIQKLNFSIIPGRCPSCNCIIKKSIKKIQFLSDNNKFITLSTYEGQRDNGYDEFSIAEIWDINKKQDNDSIYYKYAEIEVRLYQISQDFKYICSVDFNNELTLTELSKTSSQPSLKKLNMYNKNTIISILFSNKSKILSSVDSQMIVFRNLDSDQLLCSYNINIESENFFQQFTDDDKFYCTNYKNQIYLWDVNHLIKDQNFKISNLESNTENLVIQYFTISHNLNYLAIGVNDNKNNNILRIMELNSMDKLKTLNQNSKINLLLFSDDDMFLAVANELNQMLIYEMDQFTLKNSFTCDQDQIIMMQFFQQVVPQEIDNNDQPQQIEQINQIDILFEKPNQNENNEYENANSESNQVEKYKQNNDKEKDINLKQNQSIISIDKNYTIVINHLDNVKTQNQRRQLQNSSNSKIQQIVFINNIQNLFVINQDQNENFEGDVYCWYENRYNKSKTIKDCVIADFSLDRNYLVYSNQTADLYLIDLQIANQYDSETIPVKYNNTSCDPFNFLKLNSEKSILFAGSKEQMFCWKFCKEEDQAQLILLRILENNSFDYSTMLLRQDNQIFFLNNDKIQKLDFSDASGKLKSYLICYFRRQSEQYRHNLFVDEMQFLSCSFSSDLSLCVTVGKVIKSQEVQNEFRNLKLIGNVVINPKKLEVLCYEYLIIWNIRTLRYSTLLQKSKEIKCDIENPSYFAVFFPQKIIMALSNEQNIEIMDFQEFDSIKRIATVNNENKIHNLIVSKDEKLLISTCELGIFKLWNISELSQITLYRVIYFGKYKNDYRFTKDLICYSLFKREGQLTQYLEQLNLTKYSAGKFFYSFSCFQTFSIMHKQTIVAFGGSKLVLWDYNTNQQKHIEQLYNYNVICVTFANNSDLLAAAQDCSIYLIKVVVQPLDFKIIKQIEGHTDKIVCLSILHDNSMIVSGSKDKTIRFWSIKQLNNVYILQGFTEIISKISLSPNCIDMAVTMENGSIKLYKLLFPKNNHEVHKDKKEEYIQCFKVFGRQNLISAKNCILWDAVIEQDGKQLIELFRQKEADMKKV
ncbi:unnamed protein product [Paramecium primaurelia]|uniref:NACHT domain-containing protein n=1 Tax=Paramecium primaurelia TaxID=5886 RepID=A0A8S1PDU0_PARPR|nr:unnamed protein product [Paramecium primaurelia]